MNVKSAPRLGQTIAHSYNECEAAPRLGQTIAHSYNEMKRPRLGDQRPLDWVRP